MPLTAVYLVSPCFTASSVAARIGAGGGKSGSPTQSDTTSCPAARIACVSACTSMVFDGSMPVTSGLRLSPSSFRKFAGWKAAGADVARDEAGTQAKVLLAKNAHDLSRQAAILLHEALELPDVMGDALRQWYEMTTES